MNEMPKMNLSFKNIAPFLSTGQNKLSRWLSYIGLGIGVTLLTWVFGLPMPWFWGALVALLNFVPYVGAGISALLLLLAGIGSLSSKFGHPALVGEGFDGVAAA